MSDIPKRPNFLDDYVVRRAAELALPDLIQWERKYEPNPDEKDILESAIKAFSYCQPDDDGYEAAKAFERSGWSGDRELIDILDNEYLSKAIKELTLQWIKAYNITILFAIGDKVTSSRVWKRKDEVGTVIRMDQEQATVTIHYEDMNATAGYPVEVEHVQAAQPALIQSVSGAASV